MLGLRGCRLGIRHPGEHPPSAGAALYCGGYQAGRLAGKQAAWLAAGRRLQAAGLLCIACLAVSVNLASARFCLFPCLPAWLSACLPGCRHH